MLILISASSFPRTVGWTSDAYHIQNWKHFRFENCCHLIFAEFCKISRRHVSRSLTIHLKTKMHWCQTTSWKKKAVMFTTLTMIAYRHQLQAGFSKVWNMFLSLRHSYHGDIFTPLSMTRHKTKCDWLLYLSIIWALGRPLAIQSTHGSKTFCHQSEGLAMRDDVNINHTNNNIINKKTRKKIIQRWC